MAGALGLDDVERLASKDSQIFNIVKSWLL